MADELNMILDMVKELKSDVKELKKEQIKQGINLDHTVERYEDLDKELKEFDSKFAKQDKIFGAKIDRLENSVKIKKFLWDVVVKLGIGAGLVFTSIQILKYFKGS